MTVKRRFETVPELSRFEGMKIALLYSDNKKHYKPHVHVFFGEYEASVALDGEVLEGGLPNNKYILLRAWMLLREKQLYEAGDKAVRNIPFEKIDPIK